MRLDKARRTRETYPVNVGSKPEGMELFSNPIFLSAIFSLLIAQFLKSVVNIFRSKTRSFRELFLTFFWKTGGMPSSHSALAVSIATAIAIREGLDTSIFILALFFSLVVIRDALGVRRAAGLQAKALNQLGKELNARSNIPYRPVKEVHGHNPPEVIVGSLLGFFIALAFCTL
jgi:acid phosphatase family membrane protein YuiD